MTAITSAAGEPLRLPDFFTITWTNTAREDAWSVWKPTHKTFQRQMEIQSVLKGLRPCAIVPLRFEEAPALRQLAAQHGLEVFETVRTSLGHGFSSEVNSKSPANGAMYSLGRPRDVTRLSAAYAEGQHRAVASLLGYPTCCAKFFHVVSRQEGLIDSIWPMAINTPGCAVSQDNTARATFDPRCSVFLKSFGMRKTFHLPCSLQCAESVRVADQLSDLAAELGERERIAFVDSMLKEAMDWRSHYGVSVIQGESFEIITKTDFDRAPHRVIALAKD